MVQLPISSSASIAEASWPIPIASSTHPETTDYCLLITAARFAREAGSCQRRGGNLRECSSPRRWKDARGQTVARKGIQSLLAWKHIRRTSEGREDHTRCLRRHHWFW